MKKQIIETILWYFFLVFVVLLLYFLTGFEMVKDDGYSYLLPNIVLQGKVFFEHFQIAQINYNQMFGIPLLPQAQTGVLYAPHYLFYFVSNAFSTDMDIVLKVEFVVNVTVGALFVYKLLKEEGFETGYARIGSISYLLSGPILVLSGNWPVLSVYMCLMPLSFWAIKTKRLYFLALANLLMMYAGHFEFALIVFVYTSAYYVYLYFNKKDLMRYCLMWVFIILLTLPVTFPTASSLSKTARVKESNVDAFNYSIEPTYTLKSILQPVILFTNTYYLYNISGILFMPLLPLSFVIYLYKYKGWKYIHNVNKYMLLRTKILFTLTFLVMMNLVYLLTVNKNNNIEISDYIITSVLLCTMFYYIHEFKKKKTLVLFWVNVTLVTIILMAGSYFLVNLINPYYILFRWPLKWVITLPLSISVLGVFLLQSAKLSVRAQNGVLFSIVLLTIATYYIWNYSFNFNPFYKSYTYVDTSIVQALNGEEGRYYTAGKQSLIMNKPTSYKTESNKFYLDNFTNGLTANYATYFGLFSANGYDPLISKGRAQLVGYQQMSTIGNPDYFNTKKIEEYRTFGVNKYLVLNDVAIEKKLESYGMEKNNLKEGIVLYKDYKAENIVTDSMNQPLDYNINGNKINIYTDSKKASQIIIVRFLKEDDNWIAKADKVQIPVKTDKYNRIVLQVPEKTANIELEYQSKELKTGLLLALVGLFIFGIWKLYKRLGFRFFLQKPTRYPVD